MQYQQISKQTIYIKWSIHRMPNNITLFKDQACKTTRTKDASRTRQPKKLCGEIQLQNFYEYSFLDKMN